MHDGVTGHFHPFSHKFASNRQVFRSCTDIPLPEQYIFLISSFYINLVKRYVLLQRAAENEINIKIKLIRIIDSPSNHNPSTSKLGNQWDNT